ncbi:MAG: rod shape-determining protein MreD [Flavobacteriaceae bacterium]|nr:rod shape-determining protein MreD [Flavobacteriaceae bacterium]
MNTNILQNILLFIGLLLLQVIILNRVLFLGYINPFLYLLFVIIYPYRKDRGILLLLCFLLGLFIDFFLNSGGINAAATLFVAYLRLPLLKWVLGKSEIDFPVFDITKQPFLKVLTYVSILTFMHSLIIFSLEYFKFSYLGTILSRTFLTSIFTVILIMFSLVLLTKRK